VQQGREFYEAGQFSEAAKVWQEAAQAFQAEGNKLNQATALSFLSLAYQQLGQWDEAGVAISSSLQLLQDTRLQSSKKDTPTNTQLILAQALNTRGQLELAQGQAQKAIATWQQATTAYIQADDQIGIIGSLINQAQAMQALGLYRQAEKTLTQVEAALQNQPNPIQSMGLRSLGNTLRVIGNLKKSRQSLEQSLAVAEQLQSPSDISSTLLSLGNTTRAQKETEAALGFYQQAEATSTSPMTRTQAQLNQLSLLLETQQLSEALALGSKIQGQIASLPVSRASVYAQINFAQSLTRFKRSNTDTTPSWTDISQVLAKAVQQAKSLKDSRAEAYALGHLGGLYEQTQQLGNAQDLTEQALLIAQGINASDIAYRWQWQLGRLLKATGKKQEAIAAYTEAVNTLQSLRSDLVTINPDIQFSFREEVEPIYRQLVDLLLQSTNTQSEPSQQNLVQARNVIESLQLAELDNFFRTACLQGQAVQVDQVIDQDDPTAAVVYPIILPDRLEVILKLPNVPLRHYATSIAQGDVEETLEELRQELVKPFSLKRTQSLSKRVYDWLLKPAEDAFIQSQIKTLVFVLDGSLRNIPMAALYDGQQYLVQKYAVALTPGLQLLAPKSLVQGELKALTAGLTESRGGFSALSNVALEVEEIQSEVPTTVLLNQEFTSETIQNEIKSLPFPVIHLATHGQFSSEAEETFILTWDGRLNVNELENVLRNRDENQPNALELLVLSACQTAAGDKRAALGLAGVAVRAGARSTLATLWSVNDESTAVLMSAFYRELTRTKVSRAEALRLAQLSLLQEPRSQHPRYWAPFVLVGSWL
jgi:CHAT domain-containing protein/murein DD-endopeptidase MepM/ murein hydrolase activator NlpD